MSTKDAAERACKEPNPIIDGRKANVNLACIGAKPRGNLAGEFKGRREHWTVYYTSPKSFILTISYSLAEQRSGLKLNLIGWFINLSVQTFQPPNVIYRRGNFMYLHWGYTSICRLLSYPFRSKGAFLCCFPSKCLSILNSLRLIK